MDFDAKWSNRLAVDVDAESLHFRLAASHLHLSRTKVESLCESATTALQAEKFALSKLQQVAEDWYYSALSMLRFSRYLDELCLHLSEASGGQINTFPIPPDHPDLLDYFMRVRANSSLAPRVVHAHQIANVLLQRKFEQRTLQTPSLQRRLTVPRILCIPPFAVEHVMVHGAGSAIGGSHWTQLPTVGAVSIELDTLTRLVAGSRPPAPPFELVDGPQAFECAHRQQAAWREREVAFSPGCEGVSGSGGGSGESAPLLASLGPQPEQGEADAVERDGGGAVPLFLLCDVAMPADWDEEREWPPAGQIVTCDTSAILPRFLVQSTLPPASTEVEHQLSSTKSKHRILCLHCTTEYEAYMSARQQSQRAFDAIDHAFASTKAIIGAQLTPARARCLADEDRRERELERLLIDASDELGRLKKANQSLIAEVALASLSGKPISTSRRSLLIT